VKGGDAMRDQCSTCGEESDIDLLNAQHNCPLCAVNIGEAGMCLGCRGGETELNEDGYCPQCAG